MSYFVPNSREFGTIFERMISHLSTQFSVSQRPRHPIAQNCCFVKLQIPEQLGALSRFP